MRTAMVAGKPRRTCPQCGFVHFVDPKVGVGVMIVDAQQRLLLVKRKMAPQKGKWSLPAGFVDVDEAPEQSAAREALEETNLWVSVSDLVGIYHNPPQEGGAAIFILYRAEIISGHLQAQDDAADAQFFALDELPELAFASTFDAVKRLQQTL